MVIDAADHDHNGQAEHHPDQLSPVMAVQVRLGRYAVDLHNSDDGDKDDGEKDQPVIVGEADNLLQFLLPF